MKHTTWLSSLGAFIVLTRPIFLFGGVAVYALGVAIAEFLGAEIDLGRMLLGQLMVTSTQLMTQYSNEYYDLKVDQVNKNRTLFSGGSGILSSGRLSPSVAINAARLSGLVAVITLALIGSAKPVVAIIGMLVLISSWAYSAPPIALMSTGWGELAASLIVAFLVPLMGLWLQANSFDFVILPVCATIVLLHIAMLIAFELPDFDADAAMGKRTLTVRLGRRRASQVHGTLIVGAFAGVLLYEAISPHWKASLFVWCTTPVALWQVLAVKRAAGTEGCGVRGLTFGAAALFALTVGMWLIGFLVVQAPREI